MIVRKKTLNETGWRGSAELWLDAAYETLIESGIDAVRIQPLASRLGISRTSFYWFFTNREQLLDALIARWRDRNTGNLVAQATMYSESVCEAILNVFDCWLNRSLFDSQLEYAIRSWALQAPEISTEIMSADMARISALAGMFRRHDYAECAADVRARTLYLTQIGYISMNTSETAAVRMKRIPEYVCIFSGRKPTKREMERFASRHEFNASEPHALTRARTG